MIRTAIADRFAIEARAGEGGMGVVYRARDKRSGARVAVKVLLPRGGDERARFVREAKLLAALDHRNVVRFIEHGVLPSGEPFLVMEWLDAETLDQRLQRGPMSTADALLVA